MKRTPFSRLKLAALVSVPILMTGCGGSSSALGINSKMSVQLIRTDTTQDLTKYEIYLTKDANTSFDPSDLESFASTTDRPSWSDEYSSDRTSSQLTLNFRTRSTQPPYFLFIKVPATGAAFETVKLQIDVDSKAGTRKTFNLTPGTTQRLTSVRIDRNSAEY